VPGSQEPKPYLSDDTISRTAAMVFQSKGATLSEISGRLAVSRVTAIRWISQMEDEGLLVRTQKRSGMRGRPEGVYHPTAKLLELVDTRSSGFIAVLPFNILKSACRHLVGGYCSFNAKAQLCEAAICPLMQLKSND